MTKQDAEAYLRARMAAAFGLEGFERARIAGRATLGSAYPVSGLATASVATAALLAAEVCNAAGQDSGEVTVDRGLVDAWFGFALKPVGWSLPSPWDPIAGDYPTRDGWIRLHTNAPHHRASALRVLGVEADREQVAGAVAGWSGEDLEAAVVAAAGCAAALRPPEEWAVHPQGAAVAAEPLVDVAATDGSSAESSWRPVPERPLAGLRVLDLTRVLAGPVATRLLAGLGANVLRIDPPGWDEPAVVPDVMVGKRSARIDARTPDGRERLLGLLAGADVLVHGYRADALERLGVGEEVRRSVRPGLVDVSLDAYGHTGPWATRRGFDSLVQMSSGIAGWGLREGTADRPTPLPVQALDHATGYLVAAAVLAGLARRIREGHGTRARLSLARTAVELERARGLEAEPIAPAPEHPALPVDTPWGPATLLLPPFAIEGVRVGWGRGPRALGSDAPAW
jgi:crotonobetainyl-CoA:carnitine CoA-transferase CaiB-like acyl-CoA transferase